MKEKTISVKSKNVCGRGIKNRCGKAKQRGTRRTALIVKMKKLWVPEMTEGRGGTDL